MNDKLYELIEAIYDDKLSGTSTPGGKPINYDPTVDRLRSEIMNIADRLKNELDKLRAENERLQERINILEGGLVCAQCGISPYEGGLDEPF